MAITESKLTTLAQLQLQAERVKQELEGYAKSNELGALAKKSQVSLTDLDTSLKALVDGIQNAEAVNQLIQTAIAKTGHAKFEKAESVPDPEQAQDNVLYLVMNSSSGYYDIYAKVGEEVVRLDDTTTDMDGYVSEEDLSAAIKDFIKLASLSVEETGAGNAVTGLSYDSASGKFTATKGSTFLTAEDVPVATDGEVTTMLNSVFSPEA